MGRKKMGGGGHDEEGGGHGDRPWVYFMIDCFFLVTQFFVITFKVKADEVILPAKLPPGGTGMAKVDPLISPKEQINVYVTRSGGAPNYIVMSQENTLNQFTDMLANAAGSKGPEKLSVRISYDWNVPFADVIAVFNACNKVKIGECGLIPLRGNDRPGS